MKIQITSQLKLSTKQQCLVVALDETKKLSSQLPELNKATDKLLDRLQQSKQFEGKSSQMVIIPLPGGIAAEKLLLLGSGTEKKLNTEDLRASLQKLARKLHAENISQVSFVLQGLVSKHEAGAVSRHLIEALGDVYYEYERRPKSELKRKGVNFDKATIIAKDAKQVRAMRSGATVGQAIDKGKTLAKDLANMPGNVCTPTFLASQARKLARSHGLTAKVLSEKDMEKLDMGSLLSVSRGSRQPAKLIVMQYFGAKNKNEPPYALVGKGLTFDAGGISLKPGAKMDEMKYDMCGAASVYGTLLSVAEMGLAVNVVGVVPSSENLPDGLATKPGDVVTSMSGKTIEILNTDAEGRLILCDALTYTERFKPKTVIDIATLTGAVIVALGHQTSGLMGNNQALIDDLLAAGETALDYAWQLPINQSYKDQLKSDYADLANIGGPSAGSITAGCFLSYFAENFDWAHLDIAGSAWGGKVGKRASGRAVPILTQYIMDRCQAH